MSRPLKKRYEHYTPPVRYTAEQSARADELDRLADIAWEAKSPEREEAERTRIQRLAEYVATHPYVQPTIVRPKITVYRGWEIEHEKPGYVVIYPESEGHCNGKWVNTLKAAKQYIDNYLGAP